MFPCESPWEKSSLLSQVVKQPESTPPFPPPTLLMPLFIPFPSNPFLSIYPFLSAPSSASPFSPLHSFYSSSFFHPPIRLTFSFPILNLSLLSHQPSLLNLPFPSTFRTSSLLSQVVKQPASTPSLFPFPLHPFYCPFSFLSHPTLS